jgi:hypothetical protein
MFNLVADHQWPRITTYLEWLRWGFRSEIDPGLVESVFEPPPLEKRVFEPPLLEERVLTIPSLRIKEWEDDNKFLFTIPLDYSVRANRSLAEELTNVKSNITCTGETVCEIQGSVSKLFENIHRLCQLGTTPDDQTNLLKKVMSQMFVLWREPRARFMLKVALRRQFTTQKGKNTLLFLARVYYAAYIYVEIAKVCKSFRSIEIVSVRPSGNPGQHRNQRRHKKKKRHTAEDQCTNILDVIKALGLTFHPSWTNYLTRNERNEARFTEMRKSKRDKEFHHAETQLLAYFEYSMSTDDRNQSHKHIGCSRLCCWLCHVLVRAHEHFGVRGTHEALLYRWNVPMPPATNKGSLSTQLHLAMERLLMELKVSLRNSFNKPRGKRLELKAQSSHGLSSTGAIWQQKPEYYNSSYRGFQYVKRLEIKYNTLFADFLIDV